MGQDRITVETLVQARPQEAWAAYITPDHITKWNYASDDWHCPSASVDLREGGQFSSRMEAKDGSVGFDFAGTYTAVVPSERIEYDFGDRHAVVTFVPEGDQTRVAVSLDPETDHPADQQRSGWQAILDNFAKHLAGLNRAAPAD